MIRILSILAAAMLSMGAAQAAKDNLVVGMTLEPPVLDPTIHAAAAIREVVYANVFEGLTRIDRTGAVQPALAERWEISDDGLTYTFHLRRGVTYHDGSDFDSSVVKFSLDRARAEDSTNAQKGLFEPIDTVEAVDPHKAVVRLKRPEGNFLWNMGWGDAVMVHPASVETNATRPVGTGPYRVLRWVRGDRVELGPFDAYWGEMPAIPNVTFKFIPDPSAQVAAMLAGDLDAFPNMGAPETLDQFRADPRFEVDEGSTEGETILVMNHRRELFQDIRVRRAISHAIDREAIVDGAMFGQGTPIGTHFAPHHPAYVDLTDRYPYDPAKARELLAEAGYPDGFRAVMKLPPPRYARGGGEVIAAQLRDIGVEVELVNVEWAQWLSDVFRGAHDFDFTIVSHTEPLDIGIYGRRDYYFGYASDAFDAIMEQVRNETDTARRYELYGEAQRLITEDAVNVYLFQLAKTGVRRAGLTGMWRDAPVPANDVTDAAWSD